MRSFSARMRVGIFSVGFFFYLFAIGIFLTPPQTLAQAKWLPDSEVTEVGKSAVRAKQFLEWTLTSQSGNANWVFLTPDASINQLAEFWSLIRNIAYMLTLLIVLFTAFLLIISRGQNISARKQIFTVGGVLLLITFSFAILGFLYQAVDTLQNFFLRLPPGGITADSLLSVRFGYDFSGFRLRDGATEEAAKAAIFLVKATNITYYVLAGILLLRKIILWFFIILSPLWVLLLPFPLIRNTAKIWMGEFFRWLFYGPLFAVLLAGLVMLWQSGIPLNFAVTPSGPSSGGYDVAINILLGGPGQIVDIRNSVSNVNSYALYLVALLMLWVVIFLPFLLLKIFRDVFADVLSQDNLLFQKAFGALYPFLGRAGLPGPTPSPFHPSPPPPSDTRIQPIQTPPSAAGLTQELGLRKATEVAKEITIQAQVANLETLPQVKTTDIVKYAGITIPNLRDLARMEMERERLLQTQSTNLRDRAQISQTQFMLRNIAKPSDIQNTNERSRFSRIQQELLTRSRRGDIAATTILAAAESARSGKPIPIVVGTHPVGAGVGSAPVTVAKPPLMPTLNRIQKVGIDDYEDVKRMWEENYKTADVPISDTIKTREDWLKQDITKLQSVIELLSSTLEEQKKQGLGQLAMILPFLLLGGFSEQETIIYLKAKLEAAKKVLTTLEKKSEEEEEEEEVLVEKKDQEEEQKTLEAQAQEPTKNPLDEVKKD